MTASTTLAKDRISDIIYVKDFFYIRLVAHLAVQKPDVQRKLNNMIYKTSLDSLAKGITIAVTILFGGIILIPFLVTGTSNFVGFFIAAFLLVIYFGCYALSPLGYEVTATQLIIRRRWKDRVIGRNDIQQVTLLDKNMLSWPIRIFGVGGLFGYYGLYANKKMGKMTWYVTRRDKPVLIKTYHGKKMILTPDEAERFVSEFD